LHLRNQADISERQRLSICDKGQSPCERSDVFKSSLKNVYTKSEVIMILNFRDGPMLILVLSWVLVPSGNCHCYTRDPEDGGST
jgi:hypothetical protein